VTKSIERELVITARGLTKTYGDFVAVDGIDFQVSRGEAFGLLGPTEPVNQPRCE